MYSELAVYKIAMMIFLALYFFTLRICMTLEMSIPFSYG